MTSSRGSRKVIRTEDDLKFEVVTDEPYPIKGGYGERVHSKDTFDRTVREIANRIGRGLQGTRASNAHIEFGLEFDDQGGLFVTRGRENAHFIVALDFLGSDPT
jgi:NTP-dependent ternary system trypsin peptidase co-occuring protein